MRALSKTAFGHTHSLEIALVIQALGPGFTRDQVLAEVRKRSEAGTVDPPGQTAVFAELKRLREIGATERIPAMGEAVKRDTTRDSVFWKYCTELADRVRPSLPTG